MTFDFDRFLSEWCAVPTGAWIFDEENQEWIFVEEDSDEETKQRARELLGLSDERITRTGTS